MASKNKSKVAVVTGSTKGIGEAIAKQFVKDGINVVVTSRNAKSASDAAKELAEEGLQTLGLQFDLGNADDLEKLIEDTVDHFGQLDILVNNAFSAIGVAPVDSLSNEQIQSVFTTNIANHFLLCRMALPHLQETRGNIINIGSVVVNRHLMGLPLYGIIKGAMVQMTKVLAAEWAADGVRVNAINPGFVRTSAFSELGMPADMVDKSYEYYSQYHPLGRIGQPEEIGKLAAYLASEDAALLTGSIIEADGGYSVQGLPLYVPG